MNFKRNKAYLSALTLSFFILFLLILSERPNFAGAQLKIYFFDVGQGDSILIRATTGENILLDGGPDKKVLKKIGQVLPFWDRHLDYLILSHPHDDHLIGLIELGRRYQVGALVRTSAQADTAADNLLSELLKGRETIISEPQKIVLRNGCYFDFLYPRSSIISDSDLNNTSLVFKFVCGSFKILFTGDAGQAVEQTLIKDGVDLETDIIKIAHHGSDTASSQEFLNQSGAETAIISVGENNKFKHPATRIIDRLKGLNFVIYRTDKDGDIEISANNSQYLIKQINLP